MTRTRRRAALSLCLSVSLSLTVAVTVSVAGLAAVGAGAQTLAPQPAPQPSPGVPTGGLSPSGTGATPLISISPGSTSSADSMAVTAPLPEAACAPDRIRLRGVKGPVEVAVEVARTPEERAKGLMFLTDLAPGSGMVFFYDTPSAVAFWMKNTLIPLDLLFISSQGKVIRLAAGAQPMDETPIPSRGPVVLVLEVPGGWAAAAGLKEGAIVQSPLLDQARAFWPCPLAGAIPLTIPPAP